MAPGRGKGKDRIALPASRSAPSRTSARRTTKGNDGPQSVYSDVLAEVAAEEAAQQSDRPLKRRRILREVSIPKYAPEANSLNRRQPKASAKPTPLHTQDQDVSESDNGHRQTIEASSDSGDGDSDFAFEDVDLGQPGSLNGASGGEDDDSIADVAISVAQGSSKSPASNKRKPATAPEKAFRLLVHKAHILTLLGHCMYVNTRCNSAIAQKSLRHLLNKKLLSYLNPKASDTQFQRNRSFMDGLEMAKAAFKAEFEVTASGMSRASWPQDDKPASLRSDTDAMDRTDFNAAARSLERSQDTGNQLFCALLRAAGVEARLVCSLQTLPFANAPAKSSTPKKRTKPVVFAMASDTDPHASDASLSDNNIGISASIGKVPSARRRLGQPGFASSPAPAASPKKKRPIRSLSYPVFWVEAFNAAHQKWITVDVTVTNTVAKPSKIEPPLSYDLNQLTYAIAFESDGVAKDVTRRYAKAFNAKTRRQRVESSDNGTKWLKKAMRLFRRRGAGLDRDQVEDAELAQKEAREGLPGNVLDFKDHPYYALERHLRRHEVIHPRREAGKVNAGTAAKPRMEAVFRRQDVQSCKSADKWYRLGREVKVGEQPLKHISTRVSRHKQLDDDDHGDNDGVKTTALYSAHQTQAYVPPPVVRGKVPRNAFGKLDIYVPSMVPAGGTHIRHPLTQQAARILKIDHADAVTGFKFQGRHGTAINEGAVVAQEYAEAVHAVIEGMEYEALEEESRARSLLALKLWAKFLKGLQIAARVASYGDKASAEDLKAEIEREEEVEASAADAGGFVPNDAEEPAMPTAGKFSVVDLAVLSRPRLGKKKAQESDEYSEDQVIPRRANRRKLVHDDEDDEFVPDQHYDPHETGGGFLPDAAEATEPTGAGFVVEDDGGGGSGVIVEDDSNGGGFLPENAVQNEDYGGGFIPEDGGGGFIRDEDPQAAHSSCGGFIPEDSGGGFIGEDDHDNAIDHDAGVVQPALEPGPDENNEPVSRAVRIDPSTHVHIPEPEAAVLEQAHDSYTSPNETGTTAETTSEPTGTIGRDNEGSPDDDRGSLLSHDPDDEDAEPDWLESD